MILSDHGIRKALEEGELEITPLPDESQYGVAPKAETNG